jgi:hypothetical protein
MTTEDDLEVFVCRRCGDGVLAPITTPTDQPMPHVCRPWCGSHLSRAAATLLFLLLMDECDETKPQ